MGIYIRDVEKPKGCSYCPCESDTACQLLGSELGGTPLEGVRPDCPLIEIDDELIKKLQESAIVIKAVFNRLKKVVNNSDELKTELMGTNPNLTIFDECVESFGK